MIVIHIFGRSNTGKTTLIEMLCRRLATQGRIETIKHIGHHPMNLEDGKDTTIHFHAGALGSCGIDEEKSITIIEGQRLEDALDAASDRGADFCIVEGYKNVRIPGIALGDFESDHILMRDPTIEEILLRFDEFPRWTTPKAMLDSLLEKTEEGDTASFLLLPTISEKVLERVATNALGYPGITASAGVLLRRGCGTYVREERGCLAVAGRTSTAVISVLSRIAEELRGEDPKEEYNRRKNEE